MRFALYIISLLSLSLLSAQDYKLLTWKDLEPTQEFEDPYEKLELAELRQLGELAYYREIEKIAKDELTPYELSRKDSLVKWLTAAKIDYEYLFEIRP